MKVDYRELFAYDHEGYRERISKKAKWLAMTHTNAEIKEELQAVLKRKGEAEYNDLRNCCWRYIKSGTRRCEAQRRIDDDKRCGV